MKPVLWFQALITFITDKLLYDFPRLKGPRLKPLTIVKDEPRIGVRSVCMGNTCFSDTIMGDINVLLTGIRRDQEGSTQQAYLYANVENTADKRRLPNSSLQKLYS